MGEVLLVHGDDLFGGLFLGVFNAFHLVEGATKGEDDVGDIAVGGVVGLTAKHAGDGAQGDTALIGDLLVGQTALLF